PPAARPGPRPDGPARAQRPHALTTPNRVSHAHGDARQTSESPGRNGAAPVPSSTIPGATLTAPELGSPSGTSCRTAPVAGSSSRRNASEPGTATASLDTAGAANENAGSDVRQRTRPVAGSSAAATQAPAASSLDRP